MSPGMEDREPGELQVCDALSLQMHLISIIVASKKGYEWLMIAYDTMAMAVMAMKFGVYHIPQISSKPKS